MSALYRLSGFSKQNFHQRVRRAEFYMEELVQIEWLIYQIRDEHPRMGQSKLYRMLQPKFMGRDRFAAFYREKGFSLEQSRNYKRTTDSSGVVRFPNCIDALDVTHVNQVWVSDITYYQIDKVFYYLTFIMDRHSRSILGYQASRRMLTSDTTIPALKMAYQYLNSEDDKPILHSDGGGQYYSKAFLALTRDRCINSMATLVYENIHAERINGTIKNEYLKPWNPRSFPSLQKKLHRAVRNYNYNRPHQALNYQPPAHLFIEGLRRANKTSILVNNSKSIYKPGDKMVNSIQG